MDNSSGSCGCGAVTYKLNSGILHVVNCHCNMCRNHNGGSFSTYAVLPAESIEITSGNEFIQQYKANYGIKRFCEKCGTPLFNESAKYPGVWMLFVGTLNSPENVVPKINVWYENKLTWVDTLADIKSIPQG